MKGLVAIQKVQTQKEWTMEMPMSMAEFWGFGRSFMME
jgi:hypothetical protein